MRIPLDFQNHKDTANCKVTSWTFRHSDSWPSCGVTTKIRRVALARKSLEFGRTDTLQCIPLHSLCGKNDSCGSFTAVQASSHSHQINSNLPIPGGLGVPGFGFQGVPARFQAISVSPFSPHTTGSVDTDMCVDTYPHRHSFCGTNSRAAARERSRPQ